MKKIFIFAATAALLASCAQDETINEIAPSKDFIGFTTVRNMVTRNAENDKDAAKTYGLQDYHKTFDVYGYKSVNNTVVTDAVFNGKDIDYGTTTTDAWDYDPHVYWDKSADAYYFYAAAPANVLTATTTNPKKVTWAVNDFATDGVSLILDKEATVKQAKDVFNAKDLMIATDVTTEGWNSGNAVNFEFNHILSRLNVGVRIGDLFTVKYNQKQVDSKPLYASTDGSLTGKQIFKETTEGENLNKYYYMDSENKVYIEDALIATVKPVDDKTSPTSGVVKLTALTIGNMTKNGSFDEAAALPAGVTLNEGTDARWSATTAPAKIDFVFPNDSVTGSEDGETDNILNLSKEFTVGADAAAVTYAREDYKYVFQGLVIPQTIKFDAALPIEGKTVMSGEKPYLKISYTIDGQSYTYFYNLAAAFQNVYDAYKVNSREVYKTNIVDTYLYKSGDTYYISDTGTDDTDKATIITATTNSDGTTITYKNGETQVYLRDDKFYTDETAGTEVPNAYVLGALVTRAEAITLFPTDVTNIASCNTTFCEGWQNNLLITINPAYITMTATVYEWATKTEGAFNVQ